MCENSKNTPSELIMIGACDKSRYSVITNTWDIIGLKRDIISYIYPISFNLNIGFSIDNITNLGEPSIKILSKETGKECGYINLCIQEKSNIINNSFDQEIINDQHWCVLFAKAKLNIYSPGKYIFVLRKKNNWRADISPY